MAASLLRITEMPGPGIPSIQRLFLIRGIVGISHDERPYVIECQPFSSRCVVPIWFRGRRAALS
jgi:hypothetical protein